MFASWRRRRASPVMLGKPDSDEVLWDSGAKATAIWAGRERTDWTLGHKPSSTAWRRSASNLLPAGGISPVSKIRCATRGREEVDPVEVERVARCSLTWGRHFEPLVHGRNVGYHVADVVGPPDRKLTPLIEELA